MSEHISLIVLEDQTILRETLSAYISTFDGLIVLGNFRDAESALKFIARHPANVAIVDLKLPGIDGIEFTIRAREVCPDMRCIILTLLEQEWRISRALEAGAAAFLSKDIQMEELVFAIRAVFRGDAFISPKLTRSFVTFKTHSAPEKYGLSIDCIAMLKLAREGVSNKEIANHLGFTLPLVKHRFTEILKKLEARDRTHAVMTAVRKGLIALEQDTADSPAAEISARR